MEVTGGQEPVVWNKDHQAQVVMKGKRTKRSRLPSPLRLSMASSSSSAGRTSTDDHSGGSSSVVEMATTSADQLRVSTEEEDMANCLILLAKGHSRDEPSSHNNDNNYKAASSGLYVYQCKTCDRCFPSFQALGGHRASHKKPKPNNSEEKLQSSVAFANEESHHDPHDPTGTSFVLSLQISNSSNSNTNKSKVHECSICGAEFTSGQALGGHMRRHRTLVNNSATACTTSTGNNSQLHQQANKPTKNVLKLDLNLPAPEDDHSRESKLPFQSKENVLVFSASSLVDCHY